jgi:hypothetical protein
VSFLWLLPLAVRCLIGVITTISSHRKEALLYFVQSIFLLFSAMYIAKEALEIALMSGAGSEGGHGHGHGHGHSHNAEDGHETSVAGRTFIRRPVIHDLPILQLQCQRVAFLASRFSRASDFSVCDRSSQPHQARRR